MSDFSEELFQIYVQGLCRDWFHASSSAENDMPDEFYRPMRNLEVRLNLKSGASRAQNPEFQAALEIMQSPLMKALA